MQYSLTHAFRDVFGLLFIAQPVLAGEEIPEDKKYEEFNDVTDKHAANPESVGGGILGSIKERALETQQV